MSQLTLTLLPSDRYAESATLGALLIGGEDPAHTARMLAILGPDKAVFAAPENQTVFRAVQSVAERGRPFDVVQVQAELRAIGVLDEIGGIPELSRLMGCVT